MGPREQAIINVARQGKFGGAQLYAIRAILERGESTNPVSSLRGRAKNYARHYRAAWGQAMEWLQNVAGLELEYRPGPRGGDYSASYVRVA